MRLIISAYRAECNPWHNTLMTSDLLRDIQRSGLRAQLCIGSFGGQREVSVEVTGWQSEQQFSERAELLRARYNQRSVFAVLDGCAYLLTEQGTEYLGEITYDVGYMGDMPASTDHTMYLDGRFMAVRPKEAALKQVA